MKKIVVGLGCSWTQGEGGYTDAIWKYYKGKINLPMDKSMHLIPIEQENSWVNVLCRDYLTDYTPVNLGQRGIGNRGSAKSLYLTNINWDEVEDGYVIFMLSGFERFDFFDQHWNDKVKCGPNKLKESAHYNFQTMWPHLGNCEQWDMYAKHIYSEESTSIETLCNILDVQTFCKAHNLKFVLANAFDGRGKLQLVEHCDGLVDQVDWSCYMHEKVWYESFVKLLVKMDGLLSDEDWGAYHSEYRKLAWPQKYLTNCIHPTIDGYKVMAEEVYKFIEHKYLK